jgi:putative tricarboxylic transport membrane protein
MVAYFLVMPHIGMVFSSVIAYVAFVAIIGFPRKTSTIVSAIILPLLLYGFFNHVAGVPIPQADFFRLP